MLEGFGAGSTNWLAVAQQIGLIQSLYAGNRAYAESFLSSGEELVSFVRNRDTWPPSWLHVRRGDNHFVAIEGSTNNYQFGGHVPGVWIREDFIGDSSVNGGWWDVTRGIMAQLPPFSVGKWHFSGHSYGGAVAGIMAMELASDRGGGAVELMTFGTPKFMTNGYRGEIPSPYWRIEATTDYVPGLPPAGSELIGTVWRNPLDWLRTDWFFWDYGSPVIMNSKGEVNGALYDPSASGEFNVIGMPYAHYLSNYWGRANARMIRAGDTDPVLLLTMARAREGFGLSGQDQIPTGYPTIIQGPGFEPIEIPANQGFGFGGAGMPVYSVNLVFVGKNQKTWRESHAVNAGTAISASSLVVNNTVLSARTKFLSKLYRINEVEAVNLQDPRDGIVRTAGVEGQVSSVKGETAGVAVSLGYEVADNGPQRWAPVRGFPDGAVRFDKDSGNTEIDAGVQGDILAYASALQRVGCGYYRRLREVPGDPTLAKNFVLSLNGDTTPGVTIVTTAAAFNAGGARHISLHIRGVETKRALPGLSGNLYPIVSSAGSTVTIPYTMPRGGTIAPGAGSYLRAARFEFIAYSGAVEFGQVYARRTRRMK